MDPDSPARTVKTAEAGETGKHIIAATVIGVTFVVILLVLAIYFPCPTGFQDNTFKVVLALAAGGFAAILPGAISAKLPWGINAVGSLAVFAIVFFLSPANLVDNDSCPQLIPWLETSLDRRIENENDKNKALEELRKLIDANKSSSSNGAEKHYDLVKRVRELSPDQDDAKRLRQIALDRIGPWTPEGNAVKAEIAVLGGMNSSKLYACPTYRGKRLKFVYDTPTTKNEITLDVRGVINSERCKEPPEEPYFFQMNCNEALDLFPDSGFTCDSNGAPKWESAFKVIEAYATEVFETDPK